jgi:diguanylate cyclase (GGDEF)-like protein
MGFDFRDHQAFVATVRRWPGDPRVLTVALTGLLTAAGVALTFVAPDRSLLTAPGGVAAGGILLMLAVAFFLAELGQARIEFRQEAYSYSLSGIPLLLGLLYVPPQHLLLARMTATVIAFLVQRAGGVKFAFNTASYLLDTALVIALAHVLIGGGAALDARTAVLCYVSLAAVDLLMTAVVLAVIRINDGPLTRAEAGDVLLPATGFVALNTAVGFICAVLVGAGLLGGVLLLVFGTVTTVVYRGYLVLRRRYHSLEQVQEFVEHSEGTGTVDELAGRLLSEICTLVRASQVELTLRDEGGIVDLRILSDGQSHTIAPAAGGSRATDRAYAEDLPDNAAIITARSRDPAHRRWLNDHDVRDAAVMHISRSGAHGTLIAVDRLGDSGFAGDDLAILQVLGGHLIVALRNTQLVQRLRHDATHDMLTGLANRALLTERLQDALAADSDSGRPAVLLLDLERFKDVNDALGHHVGDQLLQVVAVRLEALDEPGATVARLGGDEFAILLPSTTTQGAAVAAAERVAQSLLAAVDLTDATVVTRASIGIALAGAGQTDADVLRHADTAMYAAKIAGTGIAVYSADLDAGRAERLALLADLTVALERDELELHYQPKLDLAFDLVTSVEALVRWTHPTMGPLAPDVFIPLAESTGLIEQLTDAVLSKALRQCRAWQDEGLDLSVAVNLSARNVLNTALPDKVAAALVAAGLPAQKLILEITESSIMGDPERTVPTLERLDAIGVTLSLDDFGTGYSSLSYLQRLPVREVKIDRSFIMGLTSDSDKHASEILVRSIIGLGASFGLRIVAEGVEDAEVLALLRELGCDLVQGFHIGRPMPAADLAATLNRSGLKTVQTAANRNL